MTATLRSEYPLSFNQQFLRAFDFGDADGAFGHRHVLAAAWRVTGAVDVTVLAAALRDVVERQEVLRTVVARGDAAAIGTVHPAGDPELTVVELSDDGRSRDERAEALLNEVDATPISVDTLPHLRAVLGRFDGTDSVLALATHHSATDGWSLGLIARDLHACYAARVAGDPVTEPVPSYGEFAVSQQSVVENPAVAEALTYWEKGLAGGRIVAVPTDRPKVAGGPAAAYGVARFGIDAATGEASARFARAARSTPFIVLFAAYSVVLARRSAKTDVVVPTFTSGRYDQRFAETVGPFFNMCPLRVDLAGARSFRDVIATVRTACFGAFAHEVPFALVAGVDPELTAAFADPAGAVIAFEVLQAPEDQTESLGGLHLAELRRRLVSQPVSSGIPNGALWAMDVLPTGEIVGSLKYDSNHFDVATVEGLVGEFQAVLRSGVTDPDAPLAL